MVSLGDEIDESWDGGWSKGKRDEHEGEKMFSASSEILPFLGSDSSGLGTRPYVITLLKLRCCRYWEGC